VLDPLALFDEVMTADLGESADPIDAEIAAAVFLAIGGAAGEGFEEALVHELIPEFEAKATAGALALLLGIGSVATGRAAKAATAAADRLAGAGVARPAWAGELEEPVTATGCWRFSDPADTASMLVCSLDRAGRSHGMVVSVNHLDCGAADTIQVIDGELVPGALELIRGADTGVEVAQHTLHPAEFRWHAESALEARAVHDAPLPGMPPRILNGEDAAEYAAVAMLLRARLRGFPEPSEPVTPLHRADYGPADDLPDVLSGLLRGRRGPGGRAQPAGLPAKLPAKRRKSAGPAPVYRVKVSLLGAKPPIWRRLEVPADTSLARLHDVIQVAFGWYDCHLHVFETPYGEFGTPDGQLGHRAEAPVTLEQVAPGERSRIRYTYDFGDDWEHEIVVEKVLDRDAAVRYPRCTGGRRAAPPEDCGGVWGYADLLRVLADPDDPEHEDRLEWLSLQDGADFDPDEFDADEVTEELARLG